MSTLKASPSSYLVLGLGGRILANRYLKTAPIISDKLLEDTIPLTGCFVGSLIFWIVESRPHSQATLLTNALVLRILLDALISLDARQFLWSLLGYFLCAVCSIVSAEVLRKYKELVPGIPKYTPAAFHRQELPLFTSEAPPPYSSIVPSPSASSYRWQSSALSRMLEEVLAVMDNVHQAPPPANPPVITVTAPPNPNPALPTAPPVITQLSTENSSPSCVACGDPIEGLLISLSCPHKYDVNCLTDMFLANLSTQVFPPLCCKRPIELALIEPYLPADVYETMCAKQRELSTADRLYCANPTCSTFLGARQRQNPASPTDPAPSVVCAACNTYTCARCGGPSPDPTTPHSGGSSLGFGRGIGKSKQHRCKVDKSLKKALLLGQAHGWQRCPTCRAVVERTTGCKHISCRCGAHFCYGCGHLMGSCACREKKRKDYLLVDEPAAVAPTRLLFGTAAGNAVVKAPAKLNLKGVSGSALVRMCKKSWGGVRGITSASRR